MVLFGLCCQAEARPSYSQLLGAHVKDGRVDYAALAKARAALEGEVQAMEAVSAAAFQKRAKPAQLAHLINLYNAVVLREVAKNEGLASIQTLHGGKAFDVPLVGAGPLGGKGRKVTLNELETVIRTYGDPRIHFALVCAAKSCPPLRSEPYTEAKLEAQLEDQTRRFLASEQGARRDKDALALSKLFEWYGGDFGGEAGVKSFIARYRPDLAADAGPAKLSFLPYDWSLNGR